MARAEEEIADEQRAVHRALDALMARAAAVADSEEHFKMLCRVEGMTLLMQALSRADIFLRAVGALVADGVRPSDAMKRITLSRACQMRALKDFENEARRRDEAGG